MDNQQQNYGFNIGSPSSQPGSAPMSSQPSPQGNAQGKKGVPVPQGPSISDLLESINSISRRLRVIEERYSNLISKNQLTDQNMLANHKKLRTEIKAISQEITEIKSDLTHLNETSNLIIQELRECARKEDVEVLDKYLKLWEPVRFVTQSQVEKIVRDVIDDLGISKNSPESLPPKK